MKVEFMNKKLQTVKQTDECTDRHTLITQGNSQFGARVLTPDSSKFVATDSENVIIFFRSGLFFYQ